jgi:hypothetical protein
MVSAKDMYTAPNGDEVLDRGILANELFAQALFDHYDKTAKVAGDCRRNVAIL